MRKCKCPKTGKMQTLDRSIQPRLVHHSLLTACSRRWLHINCSHNTPIVPVHRIYVHLLMFYSFKRAAKSCWSFIEWYIGRMVCLNKRRVRRIRPRLHYLYLTNKERRTREIKVEIRRFGGIFYSRWVYGYRPISVWGVSRVFALYQFLSLMCGVRKQHCWNGQSCCCCLPCLWPHGFGSRHKFWQTKPNTVTKWRRISLLVKWMNLCVPGVRTIYSCSSYTTHV